MPDNWATVEITNVTEGDALHQHNYTLVCTVQAIRGMNIAPYVYWYYPNGSQVETGRRLTVYTMETITNGSTTILSLTFSPVLHDDGGLYSCRAQVTVPWMTTQPPVKQASVNMAVISKLTIYIIRHSIINNRDLFGSRPPPPPCPEILT